jgi:hypothetical protein
VQDGYYAGGIKALIFCRRSGRAGITWIPLFFIKKYKSEAKTHYCLTGLIKKGYVKAGSRIPATRQPSRKIAPETVLLSIISFSYINYWHVIHAAELYQHHLLSVIITSISSEENSANKTETLRRLLVAGREPS